MKNDMADIELVIKMPEEIVTETKRRNEMTRKELKVGQILHDEKENCYLVYKINKRKNSVTCLDNEFNTTSIGLDFLQYFHVDDEIDLVLLISELIRG